MEVINRVNGLDLIECMKNYGQRFVTYVHEVVTKISLKKNKCKKAKYLSEEVLQIARKGEKQKAG